MCCAAFLTWIGQDMLCSMGCIVGTFCAAFPAIFCAESGTLTFLGGSAACSAAFVPLFWPESDRICFAAWDALWVHFVLLFLQYLCRFCAAFLTRIGWDGHSMWHGFHSGYILCHFSCNNCAKSGILTFLDGSATCCAAFVPLFWPESDGMGILCGMDFILGIFCVEKQWVSQR